MISLLLIIVHLKSENDNNLYIPENTSYTQNNNQYFENLY